MNIEGWKDATKTSKAAQKRVIGAMGLGGKASGTPTLKTNQYSNKPRGLWPPPTAQLYKRKAILGSLTLF